MNGMGTDPTQRANTLPNVWEVSVEICEFIKMDLPSRPTIIDPWLRKSSLVMIYAERGIGKTWFALSIALSITRGTPIGGWDADKPTGVLYIDGEMAADEMQGRIKSLAAALPSPLAPFRILSSDLLHQKGMPSVNINNPAWRRQIAEGLSSQTEIGVLILDNLSCLTPGIEENEKKAWDEINQWLIGLRHQGIAVILLHHAGKSGSQRGTSGREDALDIVIGLSTPPGYKPVDGARFTVQFEKARGVSGDSLSPFVFSIGEDSDGNTVWLTDEPTSSGNKGRVIALLGSGKTPSEITETVKCSKQAVSKHKNWAIEKGFLSEDSRTKRITLTESGREKYASYQVDF